MFLKKKHETISILNICPFPYEQDSYQVYLLDENAFIVSSSFHNETKVTHYIIYSFHFQLKTFQDVWPLWFLKKTRLNKEEAFT
jgi:hypothetical protein